MKLEEDEILLVMLLILMVVVIVIEYNIYGSIRRVHDLLTAHVQKS